MVDVNTIGRFGDMVIGIAGRHDNAIHALQPGPPERATEDLVGAPQGDDAWLSLPTATTDGRTLLVSVLKGDDSVFRYDVWDVASETKVASVPANDNGLALILPDGHALLTATNDGIYRIVSLPSGRVERTFRADFAGPGGEHLDIRYFQPIAVTPDGDVLVEGVAPDPVPPTAPGQPSSAGGGAASPTRIQLGLIDPRSGRMVAQSPLAAIAESSLGWSRDRSTLAIGTVDGTVETLDAHTLAVRHSPVVVASNVVQSVDFSADGEMLVVGGADSTLSLWSADTLTRLGPPLTIPVQPLHQLVGLVQSGRRHHRFDAHVDGRCGRRPALPTDCTSPSRGGPRNGLPRPADWRAVRCRQQPGPARSRTSPTVSSAEHLLNAHPAPTDPDRVRRAGGATDVQPGCSRVSPCRVLAPSICWTRSWRSPGVGLPPQRPPPPPGRVAAIGRASGALDGGLTLRAPECAATSRRWRRGPE